MYNVLNIYNLVYYSLLLNFNLQLVLRENDLIELPKEIGELTRLRELHIQANRLTVLPPEIGNRISVNILIVGTIVCKKVHAHPIY